MKKLILFSAFALAVGFSNAQSFTIGPMVGSGINIASVSASNVGSIKAKANGSFMGGVFARVGAKKIYLQPEVYYINKTSNVTTSIAGLNTDVKSIYKTGNVNVNALLGFKLVNLKVINFRVFAGPTMSLVATKSLVNEVNGVSAKQAASNIANSSFNIQGGIGIDITKLAIDVRYERGLSDMSNVSGSTLNFNNIMLTVGFKLL